MVHKRVQLRSWPLWGWKTSTQLKFPRFILLNTSKGKFCEMWYAGSSKIYRMKGQLLNEDLSAYVPCTWLTWIVTLADRNTSLADHKVVAGPIEIWPCLLFLELLLYFVCLLQQCPWVAKHLPSEAGNEIRSCVCSLIFVVTIHVCNFCFLTSVVVEQMIDNNRLMIW